MNGMLSERPFLVSILSMGIVRTLHGGTSLKKTKSKRHPPTSLVVMFCRRLDRPA